MDKGKLRSSAERLRRDKYDDYAKVEFFKFSMARMEDVCTLANAYLAEHPADDAELVTEEWLLDVGAWCKIGKNLAIFRNTKDGWGLYFVNPAMDDYRCRLYDLPTCGHVRRLCQALGIPLKST